MRTVSSGAGVAHDPRPLLDAVDLHGAHDFRHTFQQRGSAMGAHYRHTTPEMAARVVEAVQQRLTVVLQVAEGSLENNPNRSALGVL